MELDETFRPLKRTFPRQDKWSPSLEKRSLALSQGVLHISAPGCNPRRDWMVILITACVCVLRSPSIPLHGYDRMSGFTFGSFRPVFVAEEGAWNVPQL